jgi:hypothetical protein
MLRLVCPDLQEKKREEMARTRIPIPPAVSNKVNGGLVLFSPTFLLVRNPAAESKERRQPLVVPNT